MSDLSIGLAAARRFILGRQGLAGHAPSPTPSRLVERRVSPDTGQRRFKQFLKAQSIDLSAV